MLFWLRLASLHTLRHPKKVEKTIASEKVIFFGSFGWWSSCGIFSFFFHPFSIVYSHVAALYLVSFSKRFGLWLAVSGVVQDYDKEDAMGGLKVMCWCQTQKNFPIRMQSVNQSWSVVSVLIRKTCAVDEKIFDFPFSRAENWRLKTLIDFFRADFSSPERRNKKVFKATGLQVAFFYWA